jgi:hypothetical protein
MRTRRVDLALRLLDDQLIDAEGRRCGRVDDIELAGGPGAPLRIAALLTGAGAWPGRVPRRLDGAVRALVPPFVHRIPWEEVDDVATTVKLGRTAAQLGLGTRDGRNVRWTGQHLEGALLASRLLGAQAIGPAGERLGRVRELRAERAADEPPEKVEGPWTVVGLLVGAHGLRQRLGATKAERTDDADGAPPPNLVAWERVLEVGEGVVRVAD